MQTKDYVISANRHLCVCKTLLNTITSATPADKKCQILCEIYYISGYIIESMLSYAVLSHFRVQGDVMDSEHLKNNSFKTHNLQKKVQYALEKKCNIKGITLLTQKGKYTQQELFRNWNVKYRYEKYCVLEKEKLNEYINTTENIYKQILSKYPLI
jgi:hypothetical protein